MPRLISGFTINNSGGPIRPYFYATNTTQGSDNIAIGDVVFTNIIANVGNCYSASTSKFTAPVHGFYMFSSNPGYKQTSNDFVVRFALNNTVLTDGVRIIGGSPNSHSGISFAGFFTLDPGDTIHLVSENAAFHRNASSVKNWFSGALVA